MGEWGEANLMQIRLMIDNIVHRLKEFMENEARSCSMDFGCVTPLYVYRMFGGQYSMEAIENGLREVRKQGFLNLHL
jgi:hypothetical protein